MENDSIVHAISIHVTIAGHNMYVTEVARDVIQTQPVTQRQISHVQSQLESRYLTSLSFDIVVQSRTTCAIWQSRKTRNETVDLNDRHSAVGRDCWLHWDTSVIRCAIADQITYNNNLIKQNLRVPRVATIHSIRLIITRFRETQCASLSRSTVLMAHMVQ